MVTVAATWKELHAAALREPDEDAPRLALADYYRKQDPELGRFIELQLQIGALRRARGAPNYKTDHECDRLLKKHGARWCQTIAKYTRNQYFDRGMVAQVSIDPHMFLEYGDWLLVNAPIRSVFFTAAKEGAFPLEELLASELITRFDAIALVGLGLTNGDVEAIAASPRVHRLLDLSLSDNPLSLPAFEAIAASPHLRSLLAVVRNSDARLYAYSPAAEYAITDRDNRHGHAIWDYRDLPPDGVALEAKHGYLPWLHPKDNGCSPFDARYNVERGKLPVKPRGNPI